MLGSSAPPHAIYTDLKGLGELRRMSRGERAPEAVEAVAQQFESVFVQMMLKSMREAKLAEGIFDSTQSELYTDMYDKQLATSLSSSGNGIGMAQVMVRQLRAEIARMQGDTTAGSPAAEPSNRANEPGGEFDISRLTGVIRSHSEGAGTQASGTVRQPSAVETLSPWNGSDSTHVKPLTDRESGSEGLQSKAAPSPTAVTGVAAMLKGEARDFVRQFSPLAERAAQKLGVNSEVLLAQVALETGWGRSVIRHPDGRSSHNLFNVKADQRWAGESVEKRTVEFHDGKAVTEAAHFRSYESYQDSFDDYVEFLQGSSRYREALQHGGSDRSFIEGLQRAGYATDPNYARKIGAIVERNGLTAQLSQLKKSSLGTQI